MKITLSIEELLKAYSYRVTGNEEEDIAPIDALNNLPLNALASNRAKTIRRVIKPIVDNYFQTYNEKITQKESLSLKLTETHRVNINESQKVLGEKFDQTSINTILKTGLLNIERKINNEISELLKEEFEIVFKPLKLSDFKIDPACDDDNSENWHPFKGEQLEFLDPFIIDDIDADATDSSEIEFEGLNDAITDAIEQQ